MKTDKERICMSIGLNMTQHCVKILFLQLRVREHPVHGPYVADLSA